MTFSTRATCPHHHGVPLTFTSEVEVPHTHVVRQNLAAHRHARRVSAAERLTARAFETPLLVPVLPVVPLSAARKTFEISGIWTKQLPLVPGEIPVLEPREPPFVPAAPRRGLSPSPSPKSVPPWLRCSAVAPRFSGRPPLGAQPDVGTAIGATGRSTASEVAGETVVLPRCCQLYGSREVRRW